MIDWTHTDKQPLPSHDFIEKTFLVYLDDGSMGTVKFDFPEKDGKKEEVPSFIIAEDRNVKVVAWSLLNTPSAMNEEEIHIATNLSLEMPVLINGRMPL